MNRKLTPAEHARRLARAIASTTERYRAGCIARRTLETHVRHLWAIAKTQGLEADVSRHLEGHRAGR
jgi:hypothetical protein